MNEPHRVNLMKFLRLEFIFLLVIGGCSPTIQVRAPEEPITINLNVKIDHEVRIKLDRDLDKVISKDSKLF